MPISSHWGWMAVLSSMSCATAKIDLALYFKVLTAFLSKYSTLCNIREQVHQHILIGLGYHFGDVSFSEQNTHSFIFFINRMTENMRSGSMRQRTNVDRFRLQFSSSSLKLLSTHHISPSPWIIHLPESPRKLCYTFPQIIGQTRNKRRLTEANLIILVCRLPNSNFRKEAYLSKKLHALFVCPMCFMCSYNLTNLYFIYFCQIIFRSGLCTILWVTFWRTYFLRTHYVFVKCHAKWIECESQFRAEMSTLASEAQRTSLLGEVVQAGSLCGYAAHTIILVITRKSAECP